MIRNFRISKHRYNHILMMSLEVSFNTNSRFLHGPITVIGVQNLEIMENIFMKFLVQKIYKLPHVFLKFSIIYSLLAILIFDIFVLFRH